MGVVNLYMKAGFFGIHVCERYEKIVDIVNIVTDKKVN